MNDSYLLPRSPSRALDSRSLARHPAGWLRLVLLTAALAGSVSSQAQFRILSFDPQPDGQVNALAVQPDGKILVGGDFTHIGGQARNSLARLRPDGSVDGAFQPTIDVNNLYGDAVFCLAVRPDGKLLLGGNFGSFDGGSSNPCLALLLPNGEHDWWDFYGAPRDWIGALAVQPDGKILVAYTSYGLDRFWPDGSWDSTFNSPTTGASTVNCLAVQADGKILLGGRFTTLNGQTRNYLGRLKADGNLDDTFNPNANGEVRTLLVEPSGKIVVGGDFTQIGGQSRAYVARLEASGNVETWSYTGYLTGANGPVRSLALQADGGVLVGGYFNTLGGQNCDAGLGRLMTDGSIDFSFNLGNEIGGVTSLALQPDGNILVAGNLWYEVYVGNALELVRLSNPTPATQDITNTADTIIWLRGGSSPEVWRTTFECSTDGVNWTPLGAGTRIPGGWELTGLSVPAGANVRARGWVTGGNGSVWFVESVVAPAGTPPGIVTQPVSVSVCAGAGQGTSFSVVAGGNGPFTYQWRKGGVNLADGGVSGGYIADTTTPTLQLSGLNEAMNGDYSVVVGNSCGSVTSVVATLTVLGPSIITQPAPASQWRQRGESVTFSVAVMDSLPVTYQWFKDGLALPGRTEPTLTLTDLQRGDAGSYDVVVANPFCIVASAVAVLKVNLVVPDTFHFGSGLERADCSRLAIQPDGRILAWGSITLFGVPPFSAFFRLNPDGVSDLGFKASGARSLNSLHLQPDGKILLHVSQDALSRMNPNGTYDDGFKSWGGFYYGGVPPLHEYLESCVMDADGRTLLLYVHSDTVNQTWFCNVRILGECIRYISIDVHEPWRFSLAQLNNAGREQQVLGSGSSDLPFPAAVNAMAFQPNGQMLIGYGPWTPGYRPPQLLARLNVNGALDPSFAPAIGGGDYVDKILVQPDGKILVAGNFDTLGGQPRKLLGRLNADGTLDKDFDAKVDGEIETIFIQTDGKILLQGAFSSVQGQPRSSVARLNPDGTLDKEFNPEVEGSANSIAMQADGRIVVSGTFSRIGGQERLAWPGSGIPIPPRKT